MGVDLEKLKQKLLEANEKKDNKGSGGGNNSGFFRAKENTKYTFRLVCPPGEDDPLKEFYLHYLKIDGKINSFLCPKRNFEEECPLCDFATSLYYKEEDDEEKKSKQQKQAVSMFSKKRYYTPALVREEEEKGIQWWGYPDTVYFPLLQIFVDGYGDVTDVKKGFDLSVSYTTAKGKKYSDISIMPKPDRKPLVEDPEKVEELVESIPELKLSRKTTQEVKDLLARYLNLSEDEAENLNADVDKYGGKKEETKEAGKDIDDAFDELSADLKKEKEEGNEK